MEPIRRLRKWYQTELGIATQESELIDLPEECVPDDMQHCLFLVPPIRRWEEIDRLAFETSKQAAWELLCADKDFTSVPATLLKSQFDKLVREEISRYDEKIDSSQKLAEYIGQRGGVIYAFPMYRRLISENVCPEDMSVLDSFLAHELLHIEQERRGFNVKYPNVREGVAWVLQFLYGHDKMGFEEYIDRFEEFSRRLNPSQSFSMREQHHAMNVDSGIEAVLKILDINLRGNSKEQLKRFRSVFEMPRYSQLEAEVIYRSSKQRLWDRLKVPSSL